MHVDIGQQHTDLYQQMLAFDGAANKVCERAGLDPLLVELVKLRVSQINGCAFCLRMHTRDALAKGETADRLAVLPAWWESQYFTAKEKAAMALAEGVTRLPVPDAERWDDGSLTAEEVSAITWLAVVMNSWNRIAIRSHYPVNAQG